MATIEEENETVTNDDFVTTPNAISSETESVPSPKRRSNALGSGDAKEGPSKPLGAEAASPISPKLEKLIDVHYKDPQFIRFCRTEVINKMIILCDPSEIKYVQLFHYLLKFESELYNKETIC